METSSASLSRLRLEAYVLEIERPGPGLGQFQQAFYIAISTDPSTGAAVVPYGQGAEGSTIFLPFRATRLYWVILSETGTRQQMRLWNSTMWGPPTDATQEFKVELLPGLIRVTIHTAKFGACRLLKVVTYLKDLAENEGWGRLLSEGDHPGGVGDQSLVNYQELHLPSGRGEAKERRQGPRVRIYQLLPRLFGNLGRGYKPNGTIKENGVGKFEDINGAALNAIRQMGFTHIWLTGVLRQATGTDYSAIGLPADDSDLLKGQAGSPYAIKDYFDLCPDYAVNPANRLSEFQSLLARIHENGLRVLIDFVPNHVARSYRSTIRPELSFGANDDPVRFCDSENNFYHLHGQPLRLPTWKNGVPLSPTCQVKGTCDGIFDPERYSARVTGNNVVSPTPGIHDWYETVKLNYGFDFTTGNRAYPHGSNPHRAIPNTWLRMDEVLTYWQEVGVDGFRCDMSHMVPPEFWAWAIGRARVRDEKVFFCAEAYNNDPMRVLGGDPLLAALDHHKGNVMFDLLSAGFDAVYDDPSYKALKNLYDGGGWANDLDPARGHDFIAQNSLRYAENHDEVRLAGRDNWGSCIGMKVGKPVSAILYGLSGGPILLYSGQEVGEPAQGREGFGGDDARTTIFDYWSMPELVKWVNEHRYDGAHLSEEQKQLRAFYSRLLRLAGEAAFRDGRFFALNPDNLTNEHFGRLEGDHASGHWLYAYLRRSARSRQQFLVVANLHPSAAMRNVRIRFSREAVEFMGLAPGATRTLLERLSTEGTLNVKLDVSEEGVVAIDEIPPLTPFYFEWT